VKYTLHIGDDDDRDDDLQTDTPFAHGLDLLGHNVGHCSAQLLFIRQIFTPD
jgi:hypothetical protein